MSTIEDVETLWALNDLKVLKQGWDNDKIDISGFFVMHHYKTVKAALEAVNTHAAHKEAVRELLEYVKSSAENGCVTAKALIAKYTKEGE
jgi:hypothetical protein